MRCPLKILIGPYQNNLPNSRPNIIIHITLLLRDIFQVLIYKTSFFLNSIRTLTFIYYNIMCMLSSERIIGDMRCWVFSMAFWRLVYQLLPTTKYIGTKHMSYYVSYIFLLHNTTYILLYCILYRNLYKLYFDELKGPFCSSRPNNKLQCQSPTP